MKPGAALALVLAVSGLTWAPATPSHAASDPSQPAVLASRSAFTSHGLRSQVALLQPGARAVRLADSTGLLVARAWSAATGKVYYTHRWGPPGADASSADVLPEAGDSPTTAVPGASGIDISRDGTTMVYVGHDQLYVGPVSGAPAHQLTGAGGTNPRISPDGKQVLFSRDYQDGGHRSNDLFVINIDSTGLRRLTASADFDLAGAWSPDGRRILFTRASGSESDLWSMGLDHSGLRHVAHDAEYADWNDDDWITYVTHPDGERGDIALRAPGVRGAVTLLTTDGGWSATRFRE